MRIDFIGPFKKSAYDNIYICNLVDYFSRHIYPYPTLEADTDDVILLFDHYLWFTPKLCMIHIDIGTHFTSQKLYLYFWKKDIAIIFASFASHKLIALIKKSNNLL